MSSDPRRVDSLRTLLREYLVALDTGNEFVAEMLSRCTLEPRTRTSVLLIPLAGLPQRRPTPPSQRRPGDDEQGAAAGGQDGRHPGPRQLDTTSGRT